MQYITREGAHAPAVARVHHLTHTAQAVMLRDDLIAKQFHNLPKWAGTDAAYFFDRAERFEGANRTVSTEWKITLPRELARQDQIAAVQDVMSTILGTTHPYVWAMHEPVAHDGQPQPHVHCLWSSRTLDGIERPASQFFRRYDAADPSRGGAQKDPALIAMGQARRERQTYTDIMNFYLERAGVEARFDPAKLQDRGIDRTPEPRALPSDSNKAKYQGEITDAWAKVLAHRQARAPHIDYEQRQAARRWEQRKIELGITNVQTHDRGALLADLAARNYADAMTPKPQRTAAEEEAHLREELARVQDILTTLETQRRVLTRVAQQHRAPRVRERAITGGGYRVKLVEEDYEREQSYGR